MPSQVIYFQGENLKKLKEYGNMSGLINSLLEDYFNSINNKGKINLLEIKKEVEQESNELEIKKQEINLLEKEEEVKEKEIKTKEDYKRDYIKSFCKFEYDWVISEQEINEYFDLIEDQRVNTIDEYYKLVKGITDES